MSRCHPGCNSLGGENFINKKVRQQGTNSTSGRRIRSWRLAAAAAAAAALFFFLPVAIVFQKITLQPRSLSRHRTTRGKIYFLF